MKKVKSVIVTLHYSVDETDNINEMLNDLDEDLSSQEIKDVIFEWWADDIRGLGSRLLDYLVVDIKEQ